MTDMHGQNGRRLLARPPCHPLSRRSCVEGRSITITDEFRTASGYGSVWVVAAGIEPASIGALPIAVRAAVSYMTSIFTIAYLLARH
ncbi:hypothetical protein HT118_00625 [Escherichia coli]|nr:hypothetical protein [Escherichia coli]